MEGSIRKIEGGGGKGRSLILAKNMTTDQLDKHEGWKAWKSDTEDYCEETFAGMKEILEMVRKSEEAIDEEWFEVGEWWAKGEMLWRFLNRYTAGEAKRVVTGVREDNGWEAWRSLINPPL